MYVYDPLKDKLGRRRRSAYAQPSGAREFTVNKRDLWLLYFIRACGNRVTAPLIYDWAVLNKLYVFNPGTKRPYQSLTNRLKELKNELRLIVHEAEQFKYAEHLRHPVLRSISDKAEDLIVKADYPSTRGSYEHEVISSCVYASYWADCIAAGWGFTPQHEIECTPIEIDGETMRPDRFFIMHIPGKEPRMIFLEADNATEPGDRFKDKNKTIFDYNGESWNKKLRMYKKLLSTGEYKKFFKVPEGCKAQLHVVTTAAYMVPKILDKVERYYPKGCGYIYVQHTSAFGDTNLFHLPHHINVLGGVWSRYFEKPIYRFCDPRTPLDRFQLHGSVEEDHSSLTEVSHARRTS